MMINAFNTRVMIIFRIIGFRINFYRRRSRVGTTADQADAAICGFSSRTPPAIALQCEHATELGQAPLQLVSGGSVFSNRRQVATPRICGDGQDRGSTERREKSIAGISVTVPGLRVSRCLTARSTLRCSKLNAMSS